MTDFPTVSRVSADLYARARKGLEKYGTTLERTDLTERQWLQHHYEELLDAACYVRVLLDRFVVPADPADERAAERWREPET